VRPTPNDALEPTRVGNPPLAAQLQRQSSLHDMRITHLLCALSLFASAGSVMADGIPRVIRVEVSAAGASAERVERDLTMPMERALQAVPGLASLASVSQEGLSVVELKFNSGPGPQDELAVTRVVSKALAQMLPWASLQRISSAEPTLR